MTGRPHTPEARARIGAATRARWQDPAYRANMAAHYERTREARRAGIRAARSDFISQREAARRLGVPRGKIALMIELGIIHTELHGRRRWIIAWEFWRAFR